MGGQPFSALGHFEIWFATLGRMRYDTTMHVLSHNERAHGVLGGHKNLLSALQYPVPYFFCVEHFSKRKNLQIEQVDIMVIFLDII
jgi:hypothetical protein